MKSLVACSVFLGEEGDCQPIFFDMFVYVLAALAIFILFLVGKKIKQRVNAYARVWDELKNAWTRLSWPQRIGYLEPQSINARYGE